MPDLVTFEEYVRLNTQYAVKPCQYSKPVRLYTDIDGVFFPYMYTDMLNPEHVYETTDVPVITRNYKNETFERKTMTISYRPEVLAKYQEWANHPLVDFVFLTSWNMNAVHGISETLNIPTLGYVEWKPLGFSDHLQMGKRTAILEDQAESPSAYLIWLEDNANIPQDEWDETGRHIIGEQPLFVTRQDRQTGNITISPERYLSINTKSHEGLTDAHLNTVDTWLQDRFVEFNLK